MKQYIHHAIIIVFGIIFFQLTFSLSVDILQAVDFLEITRVISIFSVILAFTILAFVVVVIVLFIMMFRKRKES